MNDCFQKNINVTCESDRHTYVPGPDGKCGYGTAPQKTRMRFRVLMSSDNLDFL